jgi:hypothetical protein
MIWVPIAIFTPYQARVELALRRGGVQRGALGLVVERGAVLVGEPELFLQRAGALVEERQQRLCLLAEELLRERGLLGAVLELGEPVSHLQQHAAGIAGLQRLGADAERAERLRLRAAALGDGGLLDRELLVLGGERGDLLGIAGPERRGKVGLREPGRRDVLSSHSSISLRSAPSTTSRRP